MFASVVHVCERPTSTNAVNLSFSLFFQAHSIVFFFFEKCQLVQHVIIIIILRA